MECHKELGWSEQELLIRLSQLVDGELKGAEEEALEDHLKDCEHCRSLLAEIRGTDRYVVHSIEATHASAGLVARVMAALRGKGFSGRRDGARVPGVFLWAVAAAAAVGLAVLVVVLVKTLSGEEGPPPRLLDLRVGSPEHAWVAPQWEVRAASRLMWSSADAGDALASGAHIRLAGDGGPGHITRGDGLAIYAAPGARFATAAAATDEAGLLLEAGRVLVSTADRTGRFELSLPGALTLGVATSPARIFAEVTDSPIVLHVVAGRAVLTGPWGSRRLAARDRATTSPGGPADVVPNCDVRGLVLEFAPVGLRPSAWPQMGGTPGRCGRSPFVVSSTPAPILTLPDPAGVSAAVTGADDTVFLLTGTAPGRLIGLRGDRVVFSRVLPAPFVGAPAVGPDGRILVATRNGILACTAPERDPEANLEMLVPASSASAPIAGPLISDDGSFCVAYSRGISSHTPDGQERWRRDDVVAGAPPSVGPDGTVHVSSLNGRLYSLRADTGRDLSSTSAPVDEALLSHPTVASDGTAYAVSARRYLMWRAPDGSSERVTLPEAAYPLAPAIGGDGTVFIVSSAGAVYSLPARPTAAPSGVLFETGEPVAQGPLIDGSGNLFLWTASGKLIRVSPAGRSLAYPIGARDASPAAIRRDGTLVFATKDGRVFGSAP